MRRGAYCWSAAEYRRPAARASARAAAGTDIVRLAASLAPLKEHDFAPEVVQVVPARDQKYRCERSIDVSGVAVVYPRQDQKNAEPSFPSPNAAPGVVDVVW